MTFFGYFLHMQSHLGSSALLQLQMCWENVKQRISALCVELKQVRAFPEPCPKLAALSEELR